YAHPLAPNPWGPSPATRRTLILRYGENPGPVLGDRDRVFPVCRSRTIRGDHGPTITQLDRLSRPRGEHRLDRQRHSRTESRALPRWADIRDERLHVHPRTDPVPAVLGDQTVRPPIVRTAPQR